ncbi:MAG: amidohydrolase [Planctomycetaceae bacterium]|nr:MAG: amidohydrolase [Planctomycetaceae bacterium]
MTPRPAAESFNAALPPNGTSSDSATNPSRRSPLAHETNRPATRRDFLHQVGNLTAGIGLAGLAAGWSTSPAAAQTAASEAATSESPAAGPLGTGFIDAHVHVWTPDLEKYPLAEAYSRADMQPPSFTPEELFAHSRPSGVDRIVLIQMSYYQFDNSYMTDTIARFPGVFSGVAVVDEHAGDLAETLRKLHAQGVRGLRIHPAAVSPDRWAGTPGMASLWGLAADLGLAVCPLINPEALPEIEKLCVRFPKTRVVIDHFARIGIDGEIRGTQLDQLCRLAEFPQAHVKTSAFYALGKKQPPYTDLGPMIRRVRDAFGAERLMWASDCPFQVDPGHTYAESIDLIRSGLDFLTAAERDQMLRKTAERVYF